MHDMWRGLDNDPVAYADDATVIAVVPSTDMNAVFADSLNCNLVKISAWCTLLGMKLNLTKTQSRI